ncbi:glycosyltransferase WbsX family protein [Microvirga soli]|uniref:glycosyltransferase WbsX family protein n=1 Tax=Microvirga soli TaxID=1854496 RepID=UPI00191EBD7E|nr:glycoside hydrolase family 99-like domain-containing protein [Microvirga soli]
MTNVTPICFYLPQFHTTAFNDENWGAGFTEWTNVARGTPRYPGHAQPRIPGELGFYDLRHRPVFAEQIALAQAYGIYGFCFYYYRFGEQRELDMPVRSLLSSPHPNLPFCLCWANESWTRAWDGRSDQLIREQTYDEVTLTGLIDDLASAMADPRYIRVNGRPVFLIYQTEHLPSPVGEWISEFRARLREKTAADVMLGGVYSHGFKPEMAKLLDFVVQFPPHRVPRAQKRALLDPAALNVFEPERGDYFEAYDAVRDASLAGLNLIENLVPGICPDWDNSSRRPKNAHVLVGSTPHKFEGWTQKAVEASIIRARAGKIPAPFLFINAWNEWAEGAVLEPTWAHQRAYLEAFHRGLVSVQGEDDKFVEALSA